MFVVSGMMMPPASYILLYDTAAISLCVCTAGGVESGEDPTVGQTVSIHMYSPLTHVVIDHDFLAYNGQLIWHFQQPNSWVKT